MGIILKDCYGKDQVYAHDKIFIRDENGELVQFTRGTGTSSDDVRYVTFMSHDGTTEYGKKAVAVGDDCADPIARGIFDTPTKESDAQYNYTFSGWETEVNGAADSNWNKSITEDKTVYAAFESAVRYYTITYYDDDGATVLKTESLAYGSTPSYIPIKENMVFLGWYPSITSVTGDTSYTASFEEKVTFASASWAKIAEISESGKATEYFSIGDTKNIVYTDSDGIEYTFVLAIADFDHDEICDGSRDGVGMAGITIDCQTVPNEKTTWASESSALCVPKNDKYIVDDFLTTIKERLPSDLQSVIKTVYKHHRNGSSSYAYSAWDLFPYAPKEVGLQTTSGSYGDAIEATIYPLFETEENKFPKNAVTGETESYWTRGGTYSSSSYKYSPYFASDVNNCITAASYSNVAITERYVKFGFCI